MGNCIAPIGHIEVEINRVGEPKFLGVMLEENLLHTHTLKIEIVLFLIKNNEIKTLE